VGDAALEDDRLDLRGRDRLEQLVDRRAELVLPVERRDDLDRGQQLEAREDVVVDEAEVTLPTTQG
jgi:hypothetical protein